MPDFPDVRGAQVNTPEGHTGMKGTDAYWVKGFEFANFRVQGLRVTAGM